MRVTLALLAAFPALALATITITGPTSNDYWVQNTSKTITWTYTSGDPTPVNIVITNSDPNVLNGAFSIDEYVDVSLESFTVTTVTLKTGSGFEVEFVNPANVSDVYATGPAFQVMKPGTPPVSASSSVPSGSSVSGGSSSSSKSGSSSKSPSGTSSGASPSSTGNGAAPRVESVLYTLAACGFASLCSLML